jgi:hypothetical protein
MSVRRTVYEILLLACIFPLLCFVAEVTDIRFDLRVEKSVVFVRNK